MEWNITFIINQYDFFKKIRAYFQLIAEQKKHRYQNTYFSLFQCNTWLPEPSSTKKVVPYEVLFKSERQTDVKVTNIDIVNIEVRFEIHFQPC